MSIVYTAGSSSSSSDDDERGPRSAARVGDASRGLEGVDLATVMLLRILKKATHPVPRGHLEDHKTFLRRYKTEVGRIAPLPSTRAVLEAITKGLQEETIREDPDTRAVTLHKVDHLPKFWVRAPRVKDLKKRFAAKAAVGKLILAYLEHQQQEGPVYQHDILDHLDRFAQQCVTMGLLSMEPGSSVPHISRNHAKGALFDLNIEKRIVVQQDGSVTLTEFHLSTRNPTTTSAPES